MIMPCTVRSKGSWSISAPIRFKDEKDRSLVPASISRPPRTDLGNEEKPLKIIPGMIVNVDIMTG